MLTLLGIANNRQNGLNIRVKALDTVSRLTVYMDGDAYQEYKRISEDLRERLKQLCPTR